MSRDTARLRGRTRMPPFTMTCPKCKKNYFKPNGGDTKCPECDSGMVDLDKSPTIFPQDVKSPVAKKPKETKGQTKRTRASRHS